MAQEYLLKCKCGHENEVREQQAGSEIRCVSCGQVLAVPRLRQLQQLPQVARENAVRSKPSWGVARGLLFSLGLALLLTGGAVAGCYSFWRSQLNVEKPVIDPNLNPDIQQLNIEQAWTLWEQIRGLEMGRRTPAYLQNRRTSSLFLQISLVAGVVALVGFFGASIALWAPRGGGPAT